MSLAWHNAALGGLLAISLAASAGASTGTSTGAADRIAVGDTAPDFTLEATDGSSHQLSALRGEKTAVLVFFRGAW